MGVLSCPQDSLNLLMDIARLYGWFTQSSGVSTDTRNIAPDSLFFALKGPSFNANELAGEALAKGALFAVVDEARYAIDDRFFLVKDSLEALQMLARYHRSQLSIPVIGLTGSNGKTTSKELVYGVLSKKFRTQATQGNLNNHIGVPLTLLQIHKSTEIAIVEMGANHVGEIAHLSSLALPTHGFITNIGRAHIGTFGGFENIIRGKSELYQHLITSQGTVFINSQNEILMNMAKRFKDPIFYPGKDDYYACELIHADPLVTIKAANGEIIRSQLVGAYNFENIAVALCIGKYFGVPEADANAAIREYFPSNMRSQILTRGTNTVILDAYNANPSSMEAAIRNLARMNAAQKLAIVGDMYELEEDTEMEHRKTGELLASLKIPALFCGKHMKVAAEVISGSHYFETVDLLKKYLTQNPVSQATILVKASRGMKLEGVVEVIQ